MSCRLVLSGKFRLEGSSFTGREPNEQRFDFDQPRFDSRSARLSFNPDRHWALQVSHAFIESPEEIHVNEDVYRTTASAIYSKQWKKNISFNATALWGVNKTKHFAGEHAALAEASLYINRLAVYGRYEWVQKSGEELGLPEPQFGHHDLFPVNSITIGAAYDVLKVKPLRLAAGGQFGFYAADSRLDALYGANPMSFQLYLRLYPELMRMQ